MFNFINSIIKNSLRSSDLRQIGRNPRFFGREGRCWRLADRTRLLSAIAT